MDRVCSSFGNLCARKGMVLKCQMCARKGRVFPDRHFYFTYCDGLILYNGFITDNAYDPDVQASQLVIDKKNIQNHDALVFMDNGAGMDPEKLYKMLS